MTPSPLFTIFIPTIGRLDYLRLAIASAQAQTYPEIEILIGDERSADGTREYLAELAATEPRLRSYRSEERLGMPGNWQRGLELARGEYLSVVSDDDVLEPEFAARCVAAFQEPAAPEVVAALYTVIDGQGAPDPQLTRARAEHFRAHLRGVERADALVSPPIMSSAYRTAWARQFGFWDGAGIAADVDFFRRAGAAGYRVRLLDEFLVQYRVHAGAMSSAKTAEQARCNLRSVARTEQDFPAVKAHARWPGLRATAAYSLIHCLARSRHYGEAVRFWFTHGAWMPLGLRLKCALRVLAFRLGVPSA